MSTQLQANSTKPARTFYSSKGDIIGADYIYDQTYKNYKIKQKFEKDPKYSYFNAVMQTKKKLSNRQKLYKQVFQVDEVQPQLCNDQKNKTFHYSRTANSFLEPDCQIVKVQKLKRNSFRIVKEQPAIDAIVSLTKHQSEITTSKKPHIIPPTRTGHRSNLSLYEKPNCHLLSFEMTAKAKNNKSYVELQVKQKQIQIQANQSFYQPYNPKPRLEEIMRQYRKMNKHSHQPRSRKSSLPKEFVQKLYQTNRMFYSNVGKKRTSLY